MSKLIGQMFDEYAKKVEDIAYRKGLLVINFTEFNDIIHSDDFKARMTNQQAPSKMTQYPFVNPSQEAPSEWTDGMILYLMNQVNPNTEWNERVIEKFKQQRGITAQQQPPSATVDVEKLDLQIEQAIELYWSANIGKTQFKDIIKSVALSQKRYTVEEVSRLYSHWHSDTGTTPFPIWLSNYEADKFDSEGK